MSDINKEELSAVQERIPAIWDSVATAIQEAVDQEAKIIPGEAVKVASKAALQDGSDPGVTIQFGVAVPETNGQTVYFPQAVLEALGKKLIEGELPEDAEAIIPEVRPFFEAIVQGVCAGIGSVTGQSLIASDLAIRFHALTLAPAMENERHLYAVPVSIGIGSDSFECKWLFESHTGQLIQGLIGDPNSASDEVSEDTPFEQLDDDQPASYQAANSNFDRLMDIPLEISVELGRMKMLVSEVVDLGAGSVIELDRAAGEPVDVLVNGRLVARGEVVIIEDNFGVRITEILSREDRLNKLNDAA